jgi:hypothetical protein
MRLSDYMTRTSASIGAGIATGLVLWDGRPALVPALLMLAITAPGWFTTPRDGKGQKGGPA